MYEPFDKATASREDRVAFILSEIIDDQAPIRWTRYRWAARRIARNTELMQDLLALGNDAAKEGVLAKLEAENERLRQALKRISPTSCPKCGDRSIQQIARDALREGE